MLPVITNRRINPTRSASGKRDAIICSTQFTARRSSGLPLESIALYRTDEQTLTDGGEPKRIRIARVTPSLAAVMKVPPLAGRWFAADEGAPEPIMTRTPQAVSQVAVLSYRICARRYGGDRSLVSRKVTLDGVPKQVVGVMPP